MFHSVTAVSSLSLSCRIDRHLGESELFPNTASFWWSCLLWPSGVSTGDQACSFAAYDVLSRLGCHDTGTVTDSVQLWLALNKLNTLLG